MRVLATDPDLPEEPVLREAAAVLGHGGLVAFPTETFYGLGADPWNEGAVEALFAAKGRPADAPILLLLSSSEQASMVAAWLPPSFAALAARFWPGPLTLVLPAHPHLSTRLSAGTGTIGVRVPGSPLARALAGALGRPVTGTSANRSGGAPVRCAGDLRAALGESYGALRLVLDGGLAPGGQPSTVVDLTASRPRLVRAGAIAFERVVAALG